MEDIQNIGTDLLLQIASLMYPLFFNSSFLDEVYPYFMKNLEFGNLMFQFLFFLTLLLRKKLMISKIKIVFVC